MEIVTEKMGVELAEPEPIDFQVGAFVWFENYVWKVDSNDGVGLLLYDEQNQDRRNVMAWRCLPVLQSLDSLKDYMRRSGYELLLLPNANGLDVERFKYQIETAKSWFEVIMSSNHLNCRTVINFYRMLRDNGFCTNNLKFPTEIKHALNP